MDALQCGPPDVAGDAAALVAATSPPVPIARTVAAAALIVYHAYRCVNQIRMIAPLPLCGGPSWFFECQVVASGRWRSQFGKQRGAFSSLRAGRIRVRPRPGLVKNASVSSPDRPLSVTMAVPGGGRLAGWRSSMVRACSRSPASLGLARANPVTVPSQVQISSSLAPQYQREWLGQYP